MVRTVNKSLCGILVAASVIWIASAGAQEPPRVQIPDSAGAATVPGGNAAPPLTQTPGIGSGLTPVPPAGTGATLGAPAFDPFSTQPGAGTAPALPGSYPPPPGSPQPYPGYPSSPSSQFPGGIAVPQAPQFGQFQADQYLRLIQDLRSSYTWLHGSSGRELSISDFESAVTFNFPNFLWSGEPIHLSPVFITHVWDGPDSGLDGVSPAVDLPSKAYSVYGNAVWMPKVSPRVGGILDVNVGVFTDYDTITTQSVRIFGTGLLTFQLTPTMMLKGGVVYFDRLRTKLIPAGGVLWRPNPDVEFDIYFPRPKLAQRLTMVGNTNVWWYVGGEYGGGSWTIQRGGTAVPGNPVFSDQVDINDIRVMGGLEWRSSISAFRTFIEAGYVFDRELVYRSPLTPNQKLEDTFMLRSGFFY